MNGWKGGRKAKWKGGREWRRKDDVIYFYYLVTELTINMKACAILTFKALLRCAIKTQLKNNGPEQQ